MDCPRRGTAVLAPPGSFRVPGHGRLKVGQAGDGFKTRVLSVDVAILSSAAALWVYLGMAGSAKALAAALTSVRAAPAQEQEQG